MENSNIKILIVAYTFPPINTPSAQRPYFMAKFLKNYSIEPVIITSGNAYSPYGTDDSFDLKNLRIIYTSSIVQDNKKYSKKTAYIKKLKSLLFLRGLTNAVKKYFLIPDKGIVWYKTAVKQASKLLKNENDINIIYSSSPSVTNHLIAAKLAKKFNKKLIVDIRDFYYANHQELKKDARNFFDRKIESDILKKADHITFVSKSMISIYKNKSPYIATKSSLIYNGFDADEFSDVRYQSSQNNRFTIFYAGSFYQGKRDAWPLILSLESLIVNNLISTDKLFIQIAGDLPADFEKKISELNINKSVQILDIISRKRAFFLMMQSDLLWLIIGNDKEHYQTIPLKTFEYIAAKKPIILFSPEEAEVKEIIEENELGIWFQNSVAPDILSENAKKLHALYSKWLLREPLIEKTGAIQNEEVINKFQRSFQAQQLAQIIHTVNKNQV
jgi:glycosyltransferase involved in cell wall biosynthesis